MLCLHCKLQFIEQENVRVVRTNDLESCKIILHIHRKTYKLFVIFSEKVLDILKKGWYYYLARVGGICGFFQKTDTAHCDDAGDCSEMR